MGCVLGTGLDEISASGRDKRIQILGQLLVGKAAEMAFEDIYRQEMHSQDLELRDLREGRTDTDYRLYNGQGRPIYRINIKLHGARFRRSMELVGLPPEDCFPLATYKIHSALQKQHEDQLPYFFAVVAVPGLSAETVGSRIPRELVDTIALIHQAPKGRHKRDVEDAAIDYLVQTEDHVFRNSLATVRDAEWYVLSARRADRLLRENLFQRVFALRVRSFARSFRGAELDMHFSLMNDLTPLRRFLATLRTDGFHRVTTLLERGDF